MAMLSPEKALRSLRKTPIILGALLRNVSQEEAQRLTDGANGWSVLYVVCHLRDYEEIFTERATMMLEDENPQLPTPMDNDRLAEMRNYDAQDVHAAFKEYVEKRRHFLHLLDRLTEEEWARRGVHPRSGDTSVLELAINAALHDVNHMEQILKALGTAEGHF